MKVLSITKRIIFQMLNDKRSLGLIIVAPIFLMTLIYMLLGDSNYTPNLLTYNLPTPVVDQLENQDLNVVNVESLDVAKEQIENQEADALIYVNDKELGSAQTNTSVSNTLSQGVNLSEKQLKNMYILFESKDSVLNGKVTKEIQKAMTNVNNIQCQLITEYIYGESDNSMFDSMGYIMLAIMSFFVVFILAGISFLRERTNQTMERLLLTPVRRWEVILGYTLGFGFFAFIESILLLLYVIFVLKMPLKGLPIDMAIIMVLLSISAVCIGAFFSIFSNSEFQVVQFIPIIVIPQIFFSGLISLETIPFHLGYLSRIMPVYYACDALKSICIRGKTCVNIMGDISALLIFIVLFFFLNTLLLKKYRNI